MEQHPRRPTFSTSPPRNQLHDPAVLEREVRRMLADPKAAALVDNFAGQWLHLRNVPNVLPNSDLFPDFDDNLRQSMRRETELFFESIIHEDRNVLDLMTADYTFVNERLARHYGIPDIYGSRFRRVAIKDDARRGLLGQASILSVTSHAERTSPVVRGKFILENILGTPVPPPPPDVPPLKETADGETPKTMREQMAEHRANPACATCHKIMDPIGFALENFDAVGEWRTREPGGPIDASGQLADGTQINGVVGLRDFVTQPPRHVRLHADRKASDLRPRPRPRLLRHAGRPLDRPRLGCVRLPLLRDCHGHRPQHAVPDALRPPDSCRTRSAAAHACTARRSLRAAGFFTQKTPAVRLPSKTRLNNLTPSHIRAWCGTIRVILIEASRCTEPRAG